MRIIFLTVVLSILSLLNLAPLLAESPVFDDVPFDSFVSDDMKIRIRDVGLSDVSTKDPDQNSQIFYVILDFINTSTHKKFTLPNKINVVLTDEFNNSYFRVPAPNQYSNSFLIKNKNFPSLYPDEVYTETFFFERPLEAVSQLFLSLKENPFDLPAEIVLQIEKKQYLPDDSAETAKNLLKNGMKLKFLYKDNSVSAGQRYPVTLEFSNDIKVLPIKIYIISPDYFLEDFSSQSVYQIKIPQGYPAGPYQILAIAEWSKEENIPTLSDSLTLDVVDPSERCKKSCTNNL